MLRTRTRAARHPHAGYNKDEKIGGDDGQVYNCNPPLPGCPCEPGDDATSCLLPGQDEDLFGSCREGQTSCVDGRYSECYEAGSPRAENNQAFPASVVRSCTHPAASPIRQDVTRDEQFRHR